MIAAALFDLDGVLRQYDPEHPARVARAHGVPAAAVPAIAFEAGTLARAVADGLTFVQWRDGVADEVSRRYGVDGRMVADEFFAVGAATIDAEVLEIVRSTRARVPVGLLTNATSRLSEELAFFALTPEFDVVCNSWDLGVAKPDPAIFELAAQRMGAPATACFFTDDRADNVAAAQAAGMTAHHFTDAAGLRVAIERALTAA